MLAWMLAYCGQLNFEGCSPCLGVCEYSMWTGNIISFRGYRYDYQSIYQRQVGIWVIFNVFCDQQNICENICKNSKSVFIVGLYSVSDLSPNHLCVYTSCLFSIRTVSNWNIQPCSWGGLETFRKCSKHWPKPTQNWFDFACVNNCLLVIWTELNKTDS